MNSYLLKNLSGITSASIEKYLLFTGWERDTGIISNRVWLFTNREDPEFKIAVPSKEDIIDYYSRVYDLVQTLSSFQERPEEEIISALKSAYTDRIQFRIINESSKNGKIPLNYAAQCLEGLKDLVLYAACAEENAQPVCARMKNCAKNSLDKFQFGQTEYGSFIINVDVQVANEENEQLFLVEAASPPPEPDEHKIIKRIGTAIDQVVSIVNHEIQVAEIVECGYISGITANMCDAIAKLKPVDETDIAIETTIHFAEAITHSVAPPKVSTLDNVHFAFFDEIARRYKDRTLIEDVTLTGTIKMLSKDYPAGPEEAENTVRLLTKIDNRMKSISLHLSPDNHTTACNAYRDDKEIEVSGVLDKSNKFWFFSEVSAFRVLD